MAPFIGWSCGPRHKTLAVISGLLFISHDTVCTEDEEAERSVREKHSLGGFIFSSCQTVYALILLPETIALTRTNEGMLENAAVL